jgi:hypothetical protein
MQTSKTWYNLTDRKLTMAGCPMDDHIVLDLSIKITVEIHFCFTESPLHFEIARLFAYLEGINPTAKE